MYRWLTVAQQSRQQQLSRVNELLKVELSWRTSKKVMDQKQNLENLWVIFTNLIVHQHVLARTARCVIQFLSISPSRVVLCLDECTYHQHVLAHTAQCVIQFLSISPSRVVLWLNECTYHQHVLACTARCVIQFLSISPSRVVLWLNECTYHQTFPSSGWAITLVFSHPVSQKSVAKVQIVTTMT